MRFALGLAAMCVMVLAFPVSAHHSHGLYQDAFTDLQGVVKEDRGPIGMKGRVLYLVEFRPGADSPDVSRIELPAERLREVKGAVSVE